MRDLQDRKPDVAENLERVGITNLRTLVVTRWKGHEYRFVPTIELTIDLDRGRKGAHMSRLVESITEVIEAETGKKYSSFEELERKILKKLEQKHSHKKAEISMRTELVVERKTPATRKKTMECHDIFVKLVKNNGRFTKILRVDVVGNTACPHSMEHVGKPHIQRAVGTLELETAYENPAELEDMIKCVESSFSSKVYTILKTEDESAVVREIYKKPKFVEDVCREIISNAKRKFRNCRIRAKVVSQESIHRHDVVAEGWCDA